MLQFGKTALFQFMQASKPRAQSSQSLAAEPEQPIAAAEALLAASGDSAVLQKLAGLVNAVLHPDAPSGPAQAPVKLSDGVPGASGYQAGEVQVMPMLNSGCMCTHC